MNRLPGIIYWAICITLVCVSLMLLRTMGKYNELLSEHVRLEIQHRDLRAESSSMKRKHKEVTEELEAIKKVPKVNLVVKGFSNFNSAVKINATDAYTVVVEECDFMGIPEGTKPVTVTGTSKENVIVRDVWGNGRPIGAPLKPVSQPPAPVKVEVPDATKH